jgi:hypothetical protein
MRSYDAVAEVSLLGEVFNSQFSCKTRKLFPPQVVARASLNSLCLEQTIAKAQENIRVLIKIRFSRKLLTAN